MQTKTLKSIEILETKEIQCRYQVRDTEAFTEVMHYEVSAPGANMTKQTAEVQAIALAVWPPEVVAAFKVSQESK